MRFVILALCAALVLPAWSANFLRSEVFGVVGVGKTYDDEGSLGSGINGGGGFGYRLSRRFGVEAEVNIFRMRREFGRVFQAFEANGAHVMGSGLLYLTQGRGQAYLIFGGGLQHVNVKSGFGGASLGSGHGGAINFGGGVKAFVTPHVSLRPEMRVFAGDSGSVVEAPFGLNSDFDGLGFSLVGFWPRG